MIASDWVAGSVVVGDQGTLGWRVDDPVPPDARSQGEQALADADDHPCLGSPAMAFQAELVFERVEQALDPLTDPAQRPEPAWLVFAVGPQQPGAIAGDELFQLAAGKALVANHQQPRAQPVA